MNLFKIIFNWKYYSSIFDRMEEEYKIIVEIREFLEKRKFNLNISNSDNDIRKNDYNKVYLIIDIILELEEILKRQQNEIERLQYLNKELSNYINNTSTPEIINPVLIDEISNSNTNFLNIKN